MTLKVLPSTGAAYWSPMLGPGVFGAVAGGFSEDGFGARKPRLLY